MRIIIETDSNTEQQQPEVKKVSTVSTLHEHHNSTAVVSSSSPVDAGHARIPDGYANSSATQMMQLPGNTSFPIAGAIDAGAPKVQQEITVASAMPDTGNMETFNSEKAFPAGAFVSPVSN